jgi:hypothetical protein
MYIHKIGACEYVLVPCEMGSPKQEQALIIAT